MSDPHLRTDSKQGLCRLRKWTLSLYLRKFSQSAKNDMSGKVSNHGPIKLVWCVPGFSSMGNPSRLSELFFHHFSKIFKFHIKFRQSGKVSKSAHFKLEFWLAGFSSIANPFRWAETFFHHFPKIFKFHIKFHIKFRKYGTTPKHAYCELKFWLAGFSSIVHLWRKFQSFFITFYVMRPIPYENA